MTYAVEKPESAGMSARRLERIGPAMQAYVDRGVFAGISTLIARRGKVVHAEQFGWRDKEARTPMSADTIFRLYSMTKPIVCTALMTLFEEGRFRLVDPLAKYIPAFGGVKVREADGALVDPERPIMLRDLMTHTSGLTYHFVEETPVRQNVRAGQAARRLVFAGGGDRRSGAVSARLPAGFALALQRRHRRRRPRDRGDLGRPLAPFSANDCSSRSGWPTRPSGSAGKSKSPGRDVWPPRCDSPGVTMTSELEAWANGVNERIDVSRSYPVDAPHAFARGGYGLFGTIGDYWRFAQMLANGGHLEGKRILGRKTLALMHANHLPAALLPIAIGGLPLPGYGFGLGSRVALDVAQTGAPGSVGEFGWSGAAKTHYWVDPQEELIGLFMTQSMMSFDLPELDLRALAYQAIED